MSHPFAARLVVTFAVACACVPAAAQAPGADYPSRPVRLIAPVPAGSGSDIVARAIVQDFQKTFGQAVIVDNRAGANGIIGMELVAQAKPDGYTLLYGYTSALTINPFIYKTLPYNPLRDYAPIALTVMNTIAVVVHPHLPARTPKELAALARARPGQLMYGSAGIGNQTHLTAELFLVETKLNMLHVPYKGSAPAIADLVTGQVAAMFTPSAAAAPHIQQGRLRLLATCGEQRAQAFPDAPTMIEAGFPGVVSSGWGAFLAPNGTPPAVIKKVHGELVRQFSSPELRQRLAAMGSDPALSTPEAFGAMLKAELVKWERVAKAAKLYQTQ
jgi:tripartite-type tricarboxylate transporter receptor subunit TctC